MRWFMVFVTGVGFAGGVRAEECPFKVKGEVDVYATMTRVMIENETFLVRGRANREDFQEMLEACGLDDARPTFDAWRLQRRTVNITAGIAFGAGPFIPFVGWGMLVGGAIGVPIQGSVARVYRDRMVDIIEDELETRVVGR